MNKQQAIELLNSEGWTKADAKRVLEKIDFKTNKDVDELIILRAVSEFAGAELLKRQRLQASQKRLVTIRNKEIEKYKAEIEKLEQKKDISPQDSTDLIKKIEKLEAENKELFKANDFLKKDNKDLKNIVDAIRLKLTVQTKHLLQLNDSEIKHGLVKLLKSTLG